MTTQAITEFRDTYRFLSNFWPCRIVYGRMTFSSTEAAYQAAKCLHVVDRTRFVDLPPGDAKRLGRRVEMRADWDTVKVGVMRELLALKFPDDALNGLTAQLLATGTAELIEGNTWGDVFWGVCRGRGSNMLGKLLMERRLQLSGAVGQ